MSYNVYWVKNRAEKIADFEHPTLRGALSTNKNSTFYFLILNVLPFCLTTTTPLASLMLLTRRPERSYTV